MPNRNLYLDQFSNKKGVIDKSELPRVFDLILESKDEQLLIWVASLQTMVERSTENLRYVKYCVEIMSSKTRFKIQALIG